MSQSSTLPTYSAIYAFGDSLSDAGNLSNITGLIQTEPVSPPYFQQKYGSATGNVFSNGPTWVQNVSIALGLGTLSPSVTGGTDFAYGGAETGSTPQGDATVQAISLPTQLTQFQTAVAKPSANALYTISIGANDLLDILSSKGLSAQQQATDVSDAVANEISFVNSLVKDGAKNLLVLNVPDLSQTPDLTTGRVDGSNVPSATLIAEASQLTSSYNSQLVSQLATVATANAVSVHVIDGFQLLDGAIADPTLYGLSNVTSPVWNGSYTSGSSGTLAAIGAAAQDQYLYWDFLHPTEAGHQAIADLAIQQLTGSPVLTVQNTTTGQLVPSSGQVYTGPVIGPLREYINITPDNLNITATTPNWFIHAGSGTNAIAVAGGNNVLDGDSGSTFFTGGSGTDSFYIDDRTNTATSWSTVANFHATDTATLWGVSQSGFTLAWLDGQGAVGNTGLTLTASQVGKPVVALTLAGFTQADLTSGRLSVAFGTEPVSGSAYMTIHANV